MSNKKSKENTVKTSSFIPSNLLKPVSLFLRAQLLKLKINKKNINSEDPFKNQGREIDNAATDTEAEEQFGHARVMAIKEELNLKSNQIKKALLRIKKGKYGVCEVCNKMIDTDRLAVSPEATKCISCESKSEK